jgi:hypothetical protein
MRSYVRIKESIVNFYCEIEAFLLFYKSLLIFVRFSCTILFHLNLKEML